MPEVVLPADTGVCEGRCLRTGLANTAQSQYTRPPARCERLAQIGQSFRISIDSSSADKGATTSTTAAFASDQPA